MHRYFLLLMFLSAFLSESMGQAVNFEDGFEDGNFTDNPAWNGDAGDFTVIQGTPNFQLQLQGDGATGGVAYLSTPSVNAVGVWEFYINLDGFSPSGSNRADIFLMSNIADLEGAVNGYVLRAGESGSSDVFRLVRYDGGTEGATVLSGTTDISAGGEFRVKVARQTGGDWILEVAPGYDGQLVPEGGIQTDNTYSATSFFGVRATYTSTRFNKFFFDFKIDLPPFTVEKVFPKDNTVDIVFNRSYDPATVQASDFSIDSGIGSPFSVSFPNANTIRLTYGSALPSNKYTLAVNDVEDENGEVIAPNTTLEFIVYGLLSDGDVVINEFMYDPPAGLPEYVELRNTSSKFLNIKDWQLGDRNGIGTISTYTLAFAADSFLVLSSDTTALFNQFGSRNYVKMSSGSFPSLNNSGDAIRIITENSTLVDSLLYTPEWGGENIALERRSAVASSSKMPNWGDSPQGTGTPGIANQIPSDLRPPEFTDLQIIDENTLRLLFSEELDEESAINAGNYSISPDPGIQFISASNDTATLSIFQELESGRTYRVTVSELEDIFGNVLNTATREVTFVEFSAPGQRDIVINEILYKRASGGGPEFVELYNASEKNFNLAGWEIGDARGTAKLPAGTQLRAGEYLVLTDNAPFASSLNNAIDVPGFPSFNDTGDVVFLRSSDAVAIDTLNYSSSWGGDLRGRSLERKDPLAASNDASNWSTSQAVDGNTAEAQNSVFEPDETPPEIIFAKQLPDNTVEIQFSEFIRLTPEVRFNAGGAVRSVAIFDSSNANIVVLGAPPGKSKVISKTITVQNLSDVKGNVTASSDIQVAQPLVSGDVVINEIMYNPLDNSEDNQPDQSEYIELRNTRDFAISLEGIFLNDAPDEDGEVRALIPVSTQARWIPANGIMLVYADEEPEFEQSRLANFFDLPAGTAPSPIRIDRTTLSLASSDDAIFLSDSSGITIDSVFYDKSWQNPNLIDTRGIALERISPAGPSSNASNWSSSSTAKGGTPNSENSIFQIAENLPDESGISFSPNPFSPDDDGRDDNLFINYKLDEPDYLLKVRIYDRYGRFIKELADGNQAGFEGSLMWDGRKNDGSGNRIGIYIVVFEAFNSANGTDIAFKETVVLARRFN